CAKWYSWYDDPKYFELW
nr:immunoglobulin heavy chain junction region [Macaca mulatta]MOV36535.1 immunoglobulin heavy chain junction region [Macaca mulatta]